MFMSVTLQAAVHLGNDYAENEHSIENQPKRTLKQWLNVTEKLIRDQKNLKYPSDQFAGAHVAKDNFAYWQGSSVCDSKTYVFSDSVLCMERISPDPVIAWKEKIDEFQNSRQYREVDRIDGEPDGVRVKKFPRIHHIADPRWGSKYDDWNKVWTSAIPRADHLHVNVQRHCVGRKRKPRSLCVANSLMVADYARKFAQGHWSFLGSGSEKKWYGTHENKPNGEWDDVADIMMINSSGSGRLDFRGSGAFEREDLKSKGKGNCPYISMAATKPSKWFFVKLFPSISSVSTEQWPKCVKN